jgi:methyl-accepting chemotaxis protein
MPTIAEQFLETEQAANALLDELECLKTETQNYSTASRTLDAAGQSLNGLVNETTDLAEGVRDVVLALREIGTPNLLEGLEGLAMRYTEHAEKLQSLNELVRQSADRTSAASTTVETAIGSLESKLDRHAKATEQLLQGITAGHARLEDILVAADRCTATLLQGITAGHARLLQSVRWATWAASATVAFSVITFVYLLMRHPW